LRHPTKAKNRFVPLAESVKSVTSAKDSNTWKTKNKSKYNDYMREYMRKYNGEKKAKADELSEKVAELEHKLAQMKHQTKHHSSMQQPQMLNPPIQDPLIHSGALAKSQQASMLNPPIQSSMLNPPIQQEYQSSMQQMLIRQQPGFVTSSLYCTPMYQQSLAHKNKKQRCECNNLLELMEHGYA
jgi:hypothetical protein